MSSKMKSLVFLYTLIGYFIYAQSYDRLVRPGVTVAVSSSVGWGGYPNKTVDGDKRQSNYTYCMHTADGQRQAWLRVDLGGVYNLKSVKIWYRNDNPPHNTRRLQGFSVCLSNTPTPVSSDICYQDPGDQTLPVVLERDCRGEARYVWFYTDRNNDGTGVYLEICEVEIYGCTKGYYGTNCSLVCGHCGGNVACDAVNGSCPSRYCKAGYKHTSDWKCDQGCEKGFYGTNCNHACGHCAGNKTCHHVNGSCPSALCQPGWKQTPDRKCNQECTKGFYGTNCSHACGQCSGTKSCHHVNGSCPTKLCKPGWQQRPDRKCNQDCKKGFYGTNCNHACGHCAGNKTCHHVNGSCPSALCQPGWKQTPDRKCNQACDSFHFGPNCSEECSVHCKGGVCNYVTGSCTDGCTAGYYKDTCNRICNPGCKDGCNRNSGNCDHGCVDGRFGIECYEFCSVGCTSNCDRVTGNCVCKRGWQGEQCRECSPTFYGASCEEECSPHCYNGTCHVNNGSCIGGCTGDYLGDKCTKGLYESSPENPETAIGAGVGAGVFLIIVVGVAVIIFSLRRKKDGVSEAQRNQRKESSIRYEKERVAFKNENRREHSLSDARLYSSERPTNMEAQEIGVYETIEDSENAGNEINENDLSRIYVNVETIASVTCTTNDESAEYINVYLTINENQRSNSPYDELPVQN